MNVPRFLAFSGLAAGVIWGVSKLANLAVAAENLDYVITRSVISKENKIQEWVATPMSAKFIYEITLKVKNPSDQQIRFTYPYLKVLYNGTIIGTSDLDSAVGVSPLNPRGSVDLPFKIQLDGAPLLSEMKDFVSHIKAKMLGLSAAKKEFTIQVFTEANGITVPPVNITWEV